MAIASQASVLADVRKVVRGFLTAIGLILFVLAGKAAIGHLNDTAQTVGTSQNQALQPLAPKDLFISFSKVPIDLSTADLISPISQPIANVTSIDTTGQKITKKEARLVKVSEPLKEVKKSDRENVNSNYQDYITASKAPFNSKTTKK